MTAENGTVQKHSVQISVQGNAETDLAINYKHVHNQHLFSSCTAHRPHIMQLLVDPEISNLWCNSIATCYKHLNPFSDILTDLIVKRLDGCAEYAGEDKP